MLLVSFFNFHKSPARRSEVVLGLPRTEPRTLVLGGPGAGVQGAKKIASAVEYDLLLIT